MSEGRILAALRPVVAVFERLGITYRIGGSVAASTFGHARSTLDVDLVADVEARHADPIAKALQGEYYAEPDLILEAVRTRSCFNLIYLPAYFKVDVFVVKDTPYERAAFARHVDAEIRGASESQTFAFSTPEDIVLHKLGWFVGCGGSDRQWRDVLGLLVTQRGRLDLAYLRQWAVQLEVADLLEEALVEAAGSA
jgi:hypothetical protein